MRATNWVGDAVMSLPALRALRERFPSAHIAVLARPWVADLYGREPFCDELIPYTAPKGWEGIRDKWQAARNLKQRQFDVAVLLQNAFEAALVTWLARIPVRIGYDRDVRGMFLTNAVQVPKPGELPNHQRFYYLELLRRSGLIEEFPQNDECFLEGTQRAAEAGRVRLHEFGLGDRVIGVSPGAAYGTAKRWLPERFAEAAAQLANELQTGVAVFGSKDEKDLSESVSQQVEQRGVRSRSFAGATTLGEFIEMAAACELFLTNDSGAMHVASALNVPTVAVFGATDHVATGPAGHRNSIVREPVECSPCLLRECPIDHRCMTRVSVDRVASAALKLLK